MLNERAVDDRSDDDYRDVVGPYADEFLLDTGLPRAADAKGWELAPEVLRLHLTAYDDLERDPVSRLRRPGR
ncbi:hypothetical protein ABZ318_34315 [Streptomyces sp. NPDC006197]|uniref:hypothetical protein n=1 Tax=Streptomyces sp. NPDC006197 TaxID=3156685 RepID=UPI0033B11853